MQYIPVVNLLEDNIYILSKEDKFLLILSSYIRYILMVIEAAVVVVFGVHLMYDYSLIKLRRSIEAKVRALRIYKEVESRVVYTHGFLSDLKNITDSRFSMSQLNEKLLVLLGSNVALENAVFNGKHVSVTGWVPTYKDAAELERTFKESADIVTDSVQIALRQKTDGTVAFDLNFEFK